MRNKLGVFLLAGLTLVLAVLVVKSILPSLRLYSSLRNADESEKISLLRSFSEKSSKDNRKNDDFLPRVQLWSLQSALESTNKELCVTAAAIAWNHVKKDERFFEMVKSVAGNERVSEKERSSALLVLLDFSEKRDDIMRFLIEQMHASSLGDGEYRGTLREAFFMYCTNGQGCPPEAEELIRGMRIKVVTNRDGELGSSLKNQETE